MLERGNWLESALPRTLSGFRTLQCIQFYISFNPIRCQARSTTKPWSQGEHASLNIHWLIFSISDTEPKSPTLRKFSALCSPHPTPCPPLTHRQSSADLSSRLCLNLKQTGKTKLSPLHHSDCRVSCSGGIGQLQSESRGIFAKATDQVLPVWPGSEQVQSGRENKTNPIYKVCRSVLWL